MIWYINEFVLFLVAIVFFVFVIEVSFRLGWHSREHKDDDGKKHVGALQAAALVLLALLLGFTFAMAVSRFDTRKALLLDEANAIGTTLLRSQFLPESQHREVAALLEEYLSARLDLYNAGIDRVRLDALSAAASRIEERLWTLAVAAASAEARSVPIGLFIQSLNELIDDNEKRLVALDNHVPEAVLFLLFFVSAVALGFVSYECGLTGRRRFVMNVIFAMLIAMVITIILDIDRPRRGFVQISQDSMMRLQDKVNKASH
jgi:NADH:ubiquinone oxidoreductase subunit 3 (subunit A)